MHPTYRHLEDRIRLGGLTLGQWAQLVVSGLCAYAMSTLLPLPGSWSLSVAVTVSGLPAAAAIAFMSADFDVIDVARGAVRWIPAPKLYRGATSRAADDAEIAEAASQLLDFEALWE